MLTFVNLHTYVLSELREIYRERSMLYRKERRIVCMQKHSLIYFCYYLLFAAIGT